jgi:hypothetical protein
MSVAKMSVTIKNMLDGKWQRVTLPFFDSNKNLFLDSNKNLFLLRVVFVTA